MVKLVSKPSAIRPKTFGQWGSSNDRTAWSPRRARGTVIPLLVDDVGTVVVCLAVDGRLDRDESVVGVRPGGGRGIRRQGDAFEIIVEGLHRIGAPVPALQEVSGSTSPFVGFLPSSYDAPRQWERK